MALNLVIAAITFWNTIYMEKAAGHLARTSATHDPDPLAVHVTAQMGSHHPVRGFRLAFWCRKAQNCTTSAHQVHQRVGKMSKVAKCSTLEKFSAQTFRYGRHATKDDQTKTA